MMPERGGKGFPRVTGLKILSNAADPTPGAVVVSAVPTALPPTNSTPLLDVTMSYDLSF